MAYNPNNMSKVDMSKVSVEEVQKLVGCKPARRRRFKVVNGKIRRDPNFPKTPSPEAA